MAAKRAFKRVATSRAKSSRAPGARKTAKKAAPKRAAKKTTHKGKKSAPARAAKVTRKKSALPASRARQKVAPPSLTPAERGWITRRKNERARARELAQKIRAQKRAALKQPLSAGKKSYLTRLENERKQLLALEKRHAERARKKAAKTRKRRRHSTERAAREFKRGERERLKAQTELELRQAELRRLRSLKGWDTRRRAKQAEIERKAAQYDQVSRRVEEVKAAYDIWSRYTEDVAIGGHKYPSALRYVPEAEELWDRLEAAKASSEVLFDDMCLDLSFEYEVPLQEVYNFYYSP